MTKPVSITYICSYNQEKFKDVSFPVIHDIINLYNSKKVINFCFVSSKKESLDSSGKKFTYQLTATEFRDNDAYKSFLSSRSHKEAIKNKSLSDSIKIYTFQTEENYTSEKLLNLLHSNYVDNNDGLELNPSDIMVLTGENYSSINF